jgi:hypothetical protein
MMFQSVTEKPTRKQEGNLTFQWEINRRNEKIKKGKYRGKNISNNFGGVKGGGIVAGENDLKNSPIENSPIQ